jgi:hypothetical protein
MLRALLAGAGQLLLRPAQRQRMVNIPFPDCVLQLRPQSKVHHQFNSADTVTAGPPVRSVPEKRKHHASGVYPSKRGPFDYGRHSPIKDDNPFLTPLAKHTALCHKPRSSSPLRKSIVTPTLIIKRPQHRQPLGELSFYHQQNDGVTPVHDMQIYEDEESPSDNMSNITASPTPRSPTRASNKENIPPMSPWKKVAHTVFAPPTVGGSLTIAKPNSSCQAPEQLETEQTVITEDTVTTTHSPSGKNTTKHMHKETISTKVIEITPWERPQSGNDNEHIDIYRDDSDDDVPMYDEITMDLDEEKENIDPNDNIRTARVKMEEERFSSGTKRKHSEDWD